MAFVISWVTESWNFNEALSLYITRNIIDYVIIVYDTYINIGIGLYNLNNQKTKKLTSERSAVISLISKLDINNKKSWLQAMDLAIWSLLKIGVSTSLIVSLREDYESIYNFLESSDIKSFIFDNKKEVWTVLSWKKILDSELESISKRIHLLLSLYVISWKSLEQIILKNKEIKTIKEHLEIQIIELKRELKQLNRFQIENKKTINVKISTIDRLNKEKDKLSKQISSLESEIKNLQEQGSKDEKQEQIEKNDNWELDVVFELALESEQNSQKYKKQLETVSTDRDLLNKQLELLKTQLNSSSQLDIFIFKCEQFPNDCNTNDMLKYMTIGNCSLLYKKEIVCIIIDFLEEFLLNVSKWASSGTNWKEWVGWGTYANNYINPLINYIKEKWRNWGWTQNFLEFILNIDFKNLTKDIVEPNYTTKKNRVFSSVYEQLEKEEFMNIFEALSYISKKLKNIKKWNVNLSILSENIDNFLNGKKDVLERKFREVFLKVINQK